MGDPYKKFVKKKYLRKTNLIKFGYSEKATKFEKIFHLKFDITE